MNDATGLIILYGKNLFLSYLFLSMLHTCMPFKETVKHRTKLSAAAVLLLTIPMVIPVPFPIRYALLFLLLFLFSLLFSEASFFRKCFLSALGTCVALLGLTITVGGICFFQAAAFPQLLEQQFSADTCRFLPAASSCLITHLLLKGARKIYHTPEEPLPSHSAQHTLMYTISGCSMGIFFLLLPGIWHTTDRIVLLSFYTTSIALCILNISTYQFLVKISQENRASHEETLIRQQKDSQLRIDELKYQYETLQKSRHDFKNILCVIRSLNHERKHTQIEHYIASYLEHLQTSATLITTDNEYLGALISAKASEARQHDIDVHIVFTSGKQFADSVALCNMLGNMFDNAITACLKLKEGKKIILRVYDEGAETIFCMKNTIISSVLANNPDLLTEKVDSRNHGYGTRIIREVAQAHGGFADFYEEGNLFCCNVVLQHLPDSGITCQ